jgi:hypothetical protein
MYSVENTVLVFSNGPIHRFENPIAEVIDFEDAVVIRLALDGAMHGGNNVYSFGYDGKLLWQIPSRPTRPLETPFVSISRKHMFVEAFNWDGQVLVLHPKNGDIVEEGFPFNSSGGGHRTASPRNWM